MGLSLQRRTCSLRDTLSVVTAVFISVSVSTSFCCQHHHKPESVWRCQKRTAQRKKKQPSATPSYITADNRGGTRRTQSTHESSPQNKSHQAHLFGGGLLQLCNLGFAGLHLILHRMQLAQQVGHLRLGFALLQSKTAEMRGPARFPPINQ